MKPITTIILMTITCFFATYWFFYPMDIRIGFLYWGLILAYIMAVCFLCGWFNTYTNSEGLKDLEQPIVFLPLVINGIGVNFGGYLILWMIFHAVFNIPLPIGGI